MPVARTDAFRLIVDLSAPRDCSVNAGIPDSAACVSYGKLATILEELVVRGPSTLLAKIDFARAYRQIPVSEADRRLLGISLRARGS